MIYHSPFGSPWFWALVLAQWIFHLSRVGGIPFDVLDQAAKGQDDGPFLQTWAIQKARFDHQMADISPIQTFAFTACAAGVIFLAVVAQWGLAQGLALVMGAEILFWMRDRKILLTQGDTSARIARLHREKQRRLVLWVAYVLILLFLLTVQDTRIG